MNQPAIPRFCASCGGERDATAAFCEYCGRAFANGASPGPESNRAWVEAQRYVAAGDLRSAARRLDTFETTAGVSADALALRAMIYLRSVQLDEARELLDRALTVDSQSAFVHLKNAEYWQALGVNARAREALLQARFLSVGDDVQWAQVGKLLQAFDTKARWSFARGKDDELPQSQFATTERPSNVSDTKGANAWQS